MADYLTVSELRAYNHDLSSADTGPIGDAIAAASAKVDAWCGRYFTQDAAVSARVFWPDDYWCCSTDDISTTTGLIVKTDPGYDGTYSQTWTVNTDFVLLPENGYEGGIPVPWSGLRAVGSSLSFPPMYGSYYRKTVQVTARWGWTSVPAAVKQATKIMANKLYKSGDAALGVAGFGEFGAVRIHDLPEVQGLLAPFRRQAITVA